MNQAFLTFTMNEAWNTLHAVLSELTDHEFFWEPVPDCWRIYQTETGLWTYDYAIPPPQPSPLTTIGWRLIHLASCKIMYYEYAFGPAKLTFPELVIPHTAAEAVQWLDNGHKLLTAALSQSTDSSLEQPARTNWGEWPRYSAWSRDRLSSGSVPTETGSGLTPHAARQAGSGRSSGLAAVRQRSRSTEPVLVPACG
jgi:hypothetical protein